MMERLWDGILERFGQDAVLRKREGARAVQALIQPCPDRTGDREISGPLGRERRDRFRYMGPANCPLDPDTLVEWKGREYRVQSAHLMGEGVCPHWWAMLYPRDEVYT